MSSEVVRQIMPEEWELKKKEIELLSLETKLAQRELDLTTLNAELHRFQMKYLKILGGLYARLDEIEAQIAEKQVRISPSDSEIKQKAEKAREQAKKSAQEALKVQSINIQMDEFKPTDNIKKLYREIAKRVHPDLATDEKERQRYQKLMAEANRAYEEGDEVRLKSILHQWESSPEAVPGDHHGAKLVRIIRKIAQIKQRLKIIEIELLRLKESSLYQLKAKVDEAEKNGRDLLSEMAVFLTQQIIKSEQFLNRFKERSQ